MIYYVTNNVYTRELPDNIELIYYVRFWAKVNKTNTCWLWTAGLNSMGYGQFWHMGEHVMAHRFSYHIHKGKIPQGQVIDHLCKVPRCVNPDHMQAVTVFENTKRGNNHVSKYLTRTHCIRGHEYTKENTWVTKQGWRYCRACNNLRHRKK